MFKVILGGIIGLFSLVVFSHFGFVGFELWVCILGSVVVFNVLLIVAGI